MASDGARRRVAAGPLRRQSQWVVLAATFCLNLGVQYVSALLPAMRSDLHLTTVEVGWLVGGYSAPSLLFTLPLGVAADLWGPKRMLVACLAVFGGAGLASMVAGSFPELLAWRVVQGIAFAPLATLTITMAGHELPRAEVAAVQGYRSVVGSGAEFVQPLAAGAVLAATASWRIAFAAFAVPLAVAVWAALALPSPGRREARRASGGHTVRAARALRDPPIAGLTLAGFARWFLKYGFFAYVPIYLASRLHANPTEVGFIIGVPGLVAALAATQAGRIGLDRTAKAALGIAIAVFGACLAAFTLVPALWWAAAVAVIQGAADGVLGPMLNGFISVLPPAPVRVTIVSASGLARNVGKAIGPTVLGPMIIAAGYPVAFAALGAIALTGPLYLVPLFRRAAPSAAQQRQE